MDKVQLIKRLKSFIWRMGWVVLLAFVNFLTDNLGLFGLPQEVVVILALVLGEVSKFLNAKQ